MGGELSAARRTQGTNPMSGDVMVLNDAFIRLPNSIPKKRQPY